MQGECCPAVREWPTLNFNLNSEQKDGQLHGMSGLLGGKSIATVKLDGETLTERQACWRVGDRNGNRDFTQAGILLHHACTTRLARRPPFAADYAPFQSTGKESNCAWSMARAAFQSRFTVRSLRWSAAAVSATESPAKKRNSTICARRKIPLRQTIQCLTHGEDFVRMPVGIIERLPGSLSTLVCFNELRGCDATRYPTRTILRSQITRHGDVRACRRADSVQGRRPVPPSRR
jgi:hypothetical protein